MKYKLRNQMATLCVLSGLCVSNLLAKTPTPSPGAGNVQVDVADVSDPAAIKLKTSDQGIVVCGTLHDCIANYPQLKDGLIAETTKKLEAEDEIAAQHRMQILNGQKIDIPKATADKHNARIAKFAKAKEDALNAAVKKAKDQIAKVKIDITDSDIDWTAEQMMVNVARGWVQRAKAKQDELIAAGIPISDATKKAVEAAQPKPTPTPTPAPATTPAPDGL